MRAATAIALAAVLLAAGPARAADLTADPSNYQAKVNALTPGDTLHLVSGQYGHLVISNLNGTAAKPIVITGPADDSAVLNASTCCNTVEITNSSHVVVEDLTIDGHDNNQSFGVSAKGGTNNLVHDITIAGCDIIHHGGGQQQDGISTKAPTWGWVIRGNTIVGAGTGLYLGNSNGSDPFVGGIVEDNLIADPIGYCGEIKWQSPWTQADLATGIPTGPEDTLIRDNVFIKSDAPSPNGDRPNFLVSGFPASGPGSEDRNEVYANFFFHNPREALFQAAGRVSVHDNVFVDGQYAAVVLRNHQLPLREAWVYDNTVYTSGKGIDFGSVAQQDETVFGNLVFAGGTAIYGSPANTHDNVTGVLADATGIVAAPSMTLGQMDFHPLAGKATGPALDMSGVASDVAYDRDFDHAKRTFTVRGAYATSGPGWQLQQGIKVVGGSDGGTADGGVDGGATDGGTVHDGGTTHGTDGGSPGGVDGGSGGSSPGAAGGCGCSAGASGGTTALALVLLAAAALGRRRYARASASPDAASGDPLPRR